MNPNYNQQQNYYNYQQHIPGPPQPPWQAHTPPPPGAWHDPQQTAQVPQYGHNSFGSVSGHFGPYPASSSTPALPPPPPQPTSRPQESHHRPSTSLYDASQLDGRYHQTQQNQYSYETPQSLQPEQKPSLPPRPGSSLSYVSQQSAPPGGYQPAQTSYQPKGSWNIPFSQPQDHQPPTPPPRPTAYTGAPPYGTAGLPQDQYSHHAPSHHYDPIVQPGSQPQPPIHDQYSHHATTHHYDPQYPAQTQQLPQVSSSWQQQQKPAPQAPAVWDNTHQTTEGPVSPMEDDRRRNSLARKPVPSFIDPDPPSQNVQLPQSTKKNAASHAGSMTFGGFMGGPSDWQHYDPSEHHGIEEVTESPTPTDKYAEAVVASPVQAKHSVKRKSMERIRPSPKPSLAYQQPQTLQHPVPDEGAQWTGHFSQTPTRKQASSVQEVQRQDSRESTVSAVGGMGRNDSIDNVIQAWSTPLSNDSAAQTSKPSTRTSSLRGQRLGYVKPETFDRDVQTDFGPQIVTRLETRTEVKEIEVDPYADIENEYKATLKRFAGMLRQEAMAENDEDKFKIFQGFVIRELRLRSVLYGVEATPQDTPSKAVSAQRDVQAVAINPTEPQMMDQDSSERQTVSKSQSPRHEDLPTLDTQFPASSTSKDESFVIVNQNGDDDEYSPGGRPRITPPAAKAAKIVGPKGVPVPVPAQREQPGIQQPGQVSPSLNAPMTLDDYVTDIQISPSANAPMIVGSDEDPFAGPATAPVTGSLNFSPPRPLYQPFRYGDGPNDQTPAVHVYPPMESFAVLRQNQATESGRTLVHDAPPTNIDAVPDRSHARTPSGGQRQHEEAFIGLIRAKSQAIRKTSNTTPRPESPAILRAGTPAGRSTPSPLPAPVSPLVKSVQSLGSITPKGLPPQPGPKSAPHPKLEPIISALQKLPDDFSFIHARVLSWDKTNRQLRAKHDAERQARQSKYEEHNDYLFNENQIGYAEISGLEQRFRLEEAEKKYKEDQAELNSFTTVVFEHITEKIEDDIKELNRLQTNTIDLLDLESTSASKQVQRLLSPSVHRSESPPSVPVPAVMQVLLDIHHRLELRYMKVAEASFERERRRKRLELSVLYTNNDKAGIKRLEAEFVKAEKLQVLEEFRKKSERANRLLDSFDRVSVRGLAENQGSLDDVLARLQLLRDLMMGSEENGPTGQAREELLYGPEGVREVAERTAAVVDFVLNDSRALVQLLDKADVLSNDADFDLYMSEAKLTDASPAKFEKLKSEKEAEDHKVGEELASRLNGIARVPNEVTGLVREVRDKIGGDSLHKERIEKALEAAKRRNIGAAGG